MKSPVESLVESLVENRKRVNQCMISQRATGIKVKAGMTGVKVSGPKEKARIEERRKGGKFRTSVVNIF